MLTFSPYSLCRAVCIPISSPVRSKLTTTINLGIHLFNPFRFSTVLTTVREQQQLADQTTDDITDPFTRYLKAASECFKDKSNLDIIGIDESVRILRILSDDFSDIPTASKVYETMLDSLIQAMKSPYDMVFTKYLVAFYREGLASVIENHDEIKQRLLKVKLAKCRIALVEVGAIEEEEIESYLSPLIGANVEKLQQLSDTEVATLVSVFPTKQNLVDVLETRLSQPPCRIVEILTRIRTGKPEPQTLAKSLLSQYWKNEDDVEVLPVSQQIDIAWIGSELHTRTVVSNLVWRLKRDGDFFKNLETRSVIRLIDVCGSQGIDTIDTRVLMSGAAKSDMRISHVEQLSELFRTMSRLPGNAWLEHPEMSERILRTFIDFAAIRVSNKSLVALWTSFIESVGVTDWAIVQPIALRLTRNDEVLMNEFRSIIDCSFTQSRIGNLVVSRILSICGQSDDVYKAAASSIEESGSIPFHLKLSSLKGIQVIDLLERLKMRHTESSSVLHAIESLSEASSHTVATISEKMEILSLFVSIFKFPPTSLVASIADEISFLSNLQFFEFVHLCSLVRCSFPNNKLVDYLGLVDLRQCADPVQVVDLVEDLSSLGMLRIQGIASRLVTSYTSNTGLDKVDSLNRAKLSGRLLSSLLISFIVPSEKHLGVLCDHIRGHEIEEFDQTVISDFSSKVDMGQLRDLVNQWSTRVELRDETLVRPMDTMLSPGEELTQLKKFSLFVNNQSDKNLVSWVSQM